MSKVMVISWEIETWPHVGLILGEALDLGQALQALQAAERALIDQAVKAQVEERVALVLEAHEDGGKLASLAKSFAPERVEPSISPEGAKALGLDGVEEAA